MAKVTYRAPEGDDDRVIMLDVKFFDGSAVEVDDAAKVAAFKKNKFFDVADIEIEATEVAPVKRRPGRPLKVVDDQAEAVPLEAASVEEAPGDVDKEGGE